MLPETLSRLAGSVARQRIYKTAGGVGLAPLADIHLHQLRQAVAAQKRARRSAAAIQGWMTRRANQQHQAQVQPPQLPAAPPVLQVPPVVQPLPVVVVVEPAVADENQVPAFPPAPVRVLLPGQRGIRRPFGTLSNR
ncbi:hypothetical protein HK104_003846 [Borealophlyctis nickersoniae]|nr:hypothetical protein HK104_003846 [Borealophlyctis nickersoniae]